MCRRSRGAVSPDEADQAVGGNDLVGVQQQNRQDSTLLRRAELKALALRRNLQNSEDLILEQLSATPAGHAS
jgi:hypothetical protein